ncbi:hypothetical protein VN97_g6756 [Penicillium thymicola]|uniref:Uncharacterized protein n=1 Tax=Penicillium thymicola TaxID=293382 RepID=A0AAI9TGZ8_PENTH|nr:hypothetical protein VN97_g6756 [Penicillium thymicola]
MKEGLGYLGITGFVFVFPINYHFNCQSLCIYIVIQIFTVSLLVNPFVPRLNRPAVSNVKETSEINNLTYYCLCQFEWYIWW